jgi:glycosyltransferase involved in cell wall biosynthesis
MRVAYVCTDPGVPVFGRKGCSVHVREMVRALIARGARIELFASSLGGEMPADLELVRVSLLPEVAAADVAERERLLMGRNAALDAALGERAFDLVYERYALWSYAGVEWAERHGVPCVLEVNAPLIEEQASHRTLVDRAAAEEVARRVFGAATGVACVSEEVAGYVREFGVAAERVHVIPNGVDPRRFSPEARVPGRPGEFTVGFVGTLKPWHGVGTLVEAFGRVRREMAGARLLIVGDGPERERLAARVACLGLDGAVEWTGAVDPERVPALLGRMDVAVAPYPAIERFYFSPLKLYEYMAAGLAVVASRVGQVGGVVRDGETGVLVQAGDAVALAGAIARLGGDAALRQRLGVAARAAVMNQHTWEQAADRVLAIAGIRTGAETEAEAV